MTSTLLADGISRQNRTVQGKGSYDLVIWVPLVVDSPRMG